MPMALYGLEVPCGDVAISARPEIQSAFRITMAALDPSAEAEGDEGAPPRATLKVIRQPLSLDDFSDDEDDDEDEFDAEEMERMLAEDDDDDEEDEDDEEVNGGPSDPSKSKKARREAAAKEIAKLLKAEGMDVDDDDDDEDEDVPNGVDGVLKSVKSKGKMPVGDLDDEDEDESDEDDDEEGEIEEFVLCTLDPQKVGCGCDCIRRIYTNPSQNYQQPLDITIGEDERVWFKVTGTHSIYLTGNFVEPADSRPDLYDPEDDDDDDYDLDPDELELDEEEDEGEDDELDALQDPRITELMDEDDEQPPKLVEAANQKKKAVRAKTTAEKKANNKRSAPESADEADEPSLDAMIAKEAAAASTNGEKLSKKQLKKMKKNDGTAAAVDATTGAPSSAKSDKKVSFAKELEQGPTPTKADKAADKDTAKTGLGVKKVQGVTLDDKKLGTGPAAKNGDRVGMRYIGKLQDGKVFDSNKKGKPFTFKLGAGEVIKGWEIGIQGMSAGGERRITIPSSLAYGSKASGPIPANSTLVFDVKLLELNKGR